jgi:hypothetical protein
MRKLGVGCWLLISLLAIGTSEAQPASNPTDRQLQAAYCLGAMQEAAARPAPPPRSLDAIAEGLKSEPWFEPQYRALERFETPSQLHDALMSEAEGIAKAEEMARSLIQTYKNRQQRFLSYLTATGVFAPGNSQATVGVEIARTQGIADWKQCMAALEKGQCKSDEKTPVEKYWECQMSIPACGKTKQRCNELEAELPF